MKQGAATVVFALVAPVAQSSAKKSSEIQNGSLLTDCKVRTFCSLADFHHQCCTKLEAVCPLAELSANLYGGLDLMRQTKTLPFFLEQVCTSNKVFGSSYHAKRVSRIVASCLLYLVRGRPVCEQLRPICFEQVWQQAEQIVSR